MTRLGKTKLSRVGHAYSTVAVARVSSFHGERSAAEELPNVFGSNVDKCEATAWWLLVYIPCQKLIARHSRKRIPFLIGKKNNFEAHFESGIVRNSVPKM